MSFVTSNCRSVTLYVTANEEVTLRPDVLQIRTDKNLVFVFRVCGSVHLQSLK